MRPLLASRAISHTEITEMPKRPSAACSTLDDSLSRQPTGRPGHGPTRTIHGCRADNAAVSATTAGRTLGRLPAWIEIRLGVPLPPPILRRGAPEDRPRRSRCRPCNRITAGAVRVPPTPASRLGLPRLVMMIDLRICAISSMSFQALGLEFSAEISMGAPLLTMSNGHKITLTCPPSQAARFSAMGKRTAAACQSSPSSRRSMAGIPGSSGGDSLAPSRSICAISAATASRPSRSRTASRGVRSFSTGILVSSHSV